MNACLGMNYEFWSEPNPSSDAAYGLLLLKVPKQSTEVETDKEPSDAKKPKGMKRIRWCPVQLLICVDFGAIRHKSNCTP